MPAHELIQQDKEWITQRAETSRAGFFVQLFQSLRGRFIVDPVKKLSWYLEDGERRLLKIRDGAASDNSRIVASNLRQAAKYQKSLDKIDKLAGVSADDEVKSLIWEAALVQLRVLSEIRDLAHSSALEKLNGSRQAILARWANILEPLTLDEESFKKILDNQPGSHLRWFSLMEVNQELGRYFSQLALGNKLRAVISSRLFETMEGNANFQAVFEDYITKLPGNPGVQWKILDYLQKNCEIQWCDGYDLSWDRLKDIKLGWLLQDLKNPSVRYPILYDQMTKLGWGDRRLLAVLREYLEPSLKEILDKMMARGGPQFLEGIEAEFYGDIWDIVVLRKLKTVSDNQIARNMDDVMKKHLAAMFVLYDSESKKKGIPPRFAFGEPEVINIIDDVKPLVSAKEKIFLNEIRRGTLLKLKARIEQVNDVDILHTLEKKINSDKGIQEELKTVMPSYNQVIEKRKMELDGALKEKLEKIKEEDKKNKEELKRLLEDKRRILERMSNGAE